MGVHCQISRRESIDKIKTGFVKIMLDSIILIRHTYRERGRAQKTKMV